VVVERWQSLANKQAKLDGDGPTFEEIAQEQRGVSAWDWNVSKASIHRRLRELEAVTAWAHTIDYPPLTYADIIEIEQRIRAGGRLTRPEMDHLEQYILIVDGELLMGAGSDALRWSAT
jgi:hypothetical protein